MALIRPSGKATIIAIPEVIAVPAKSGRTPNFLLEKSGVHSLPVKNSQTETSWKNRIVSVMSTAIIPMVMTMEENAASLMSTSMAYSPTRRAYTASLASIEYVINCYAYLRPSCKCRTHCTLFKFISCAFIRISRQRNVSYLRHQLCCLIQVVLNETAYVLSISSCLRYVNEYWTR